MCGCASLVLAEKLKVLKGLLKVWNSDVFRNLKVNKFETLDKNAA